MSFFSKLPDPDNIGSSEYRTLHDFLGDLMGTDEEREDMMVACLGEFVGHALGMLKIAGKTLQIKVTSEGGCATVELPEELQLVNVIQIDADEENQHVLTYKDVSIYECVKDFDMTSDCWLSTMVNCNWESEDAFDVRDLPEPPEGYLPEGVDHDNSDHLALAWAIDLGNMFDEGYDERWERIETGEELLQGDQRMVGGEWEEISVLSAGEKALPAFVYRRKIKK